MPKFNFEDDDELLDPVTGQRPVYPAPEGKLVAPRPIQAEESIASSGRSIPQSNPKAIPEPVLQKLEATDPDLVARYRAKMSVADQSVKDAEGQQDLATYGNIAGKLANDYGDSQKNDTIYHNSWSKMGNAPQIQEAERKAYDGSMLDKLGSQGVARAQQNKKDQEGQFFNEEKLADLNQSRADSNQSRADQAKVRATQTSKEDPNSQESIQMRDFIKTNYPGVVSGNFDKASASFLESKLPMMAQKFQADENRKMRSEDRQATRENTSELKKLAAGQRAAEHSEKTAERMEQLRVGDLGYAQTADDAKQLKTAVESKDNFDGKLDELISLREKHGGGAIMNREDVGRANQLSKDLLLEYKNMAKLGVLSVSDEKILNKIIPSDPLEYNSPLAAIQGQDPILQNMKKFKADAARDYQTKLNNRLRREGRSEQTSNSAAPKIVHGSDLPD